MKNGIQYIFKISIFLFCTHTIACPDALPIIDPNFCKSFDIAAKCYCVSSGLPAKMCDSTNKVYKRMLSVFGSIENACAFQKNTTYQKCLDNWYCYIRGGSNSENQWCSGTGESCI